MDNPACSPNYAFAGVFVTAWLADALGGDHVSRSAVLRKLLRAGQRLEVGVTG
jgi:hypothetical protein